MTTFTAIVTYTPDADAKFASTEYREERYTVEAADADDAEDAAERAHMARFPESIVEFIEFA